MNAMEQATQAMMSGDGAVRIPPPVDVTAQLEQAFQHGTNREWTLALRDYLLDGARRHTAAAGCPISDRAAQVLAAVMAQGLAEVTRSAR